MKHYTNILLVVLLTASLGFANTINHSSATYTFTIHLGAFVNPQLTDFENIRSYGYLYTQKFNNLLQIYMGDYPSESDAAKVLNKVKTSGYPDAFITRRNLDVGKATSIIQLGSEKVGASIDWARFAQAGPLQVYQNGNNVHIITGPFEDLNTAQNHLNIVRKIGFIDAFIKNVNSVRLHKVTDFETGGFIQVPQTYEEIKMPEETAKEVVIAEIPPKKNAIPNVMIKKKSRPSVDKKKEEPRPKTYDSVIMPNPLKNISNKTKASTSSKKGTSSSKSTLKRKSGTTTLALPKIRQKVKRTSILKLQEVLKLKGTYRSSLDGLYGPGTQKSLKEMMANNKEIQKYKLLSQLYHSDAPADSYLQETIYKMNQDIAVGIIKLKSQKTVLSKAYQAYGIFALSGKNKETDKLMNQAIKESFQNKKLKNKPPFDYTAKYSYSDYGQLIKHMRFIHGISNEKIVVPCWLFNDHKKEALAAFNPTNDLAIGDYTIQDCANIKNWESIDLLETIIKEMTPNLTDIDSKQVNKLQSKRATLLLAPSALSIEDYKKIDAWNTNLWSGLAKWESSDPLHSRMITPLKVTYFQSWALLEDYFMDKGLSPKEARGLSLCVLKTIVAPYLSRYSE